MPLIAWLVPVWFHVYFFIWLFLGGFYKETKWIVIAGAASVIIGIAIHIRYKKQQL